MKTYLQAYFDKLKSLVLGKSQITQIVPADCYRLALEIKSATAKSVSETTLKRVFGFASSVHQPSIYTLNTLAEYCGFESWNHFYVQMEQGKLQTSQQRSWGEISVNATKISLFNIQSNKHKCGIPYHLTIDRECIHTFMDHFHRSGATTGILSGDTGHGKTIAISRWVEKQICQNHANSINDIYLFTNSLSLLQGTAFGYHSNRWLAHLLGFDTSDLLDAFMETHRDTAPGNFYLIIDELHSDLIADRQFYSVINQFIDMVCHFAQYRWFRIVLMLRTVTLLKYESIFKDTIINPQWFSVLSKTSGNESANIPTLSNAELHQLIRNINGKTKSYHLLPSNQKRLIHIPLFFQYYYELNGEELDLSQVTTFDEYLVITQYLKKRVFNGVNTMAKQALMEDLSLLIEQNGDLLQVSKKQAYTIVKQYKTAYNDLLHSGIIAETNDGLEVRQQTVIRFQSNIVATYFMALRLFNKHCETRELIQELDRAEITNQTKTEQLRWLLLFYIEAGNMQLANQVDSVPFLKENRFEVMAFICDALDKLGQSNRPIARPKLNNNRFVDYMLNHSCFQTGYESNIAKLLAFDLSETHEVILRSKLAFIALLKWEEEDLLRQLDALSAKQPETFANFLINPLHVLSYLYQYFKEGIVDHNISRDLNALPHKLSLPDHTSGSQLFDLLIYMLIKISGNAGTARRYSEVIRRRLEEMHPAQTFEVDFTTLIYALYLLECNEPELATALVAKGNALSLDNLSYRLLHALFHLHSGKITHDVNYRILGQRAISICETYGFKLLEAYCRILILEDIPKDEQTQHINNLKFQFAAFGYTIGLGALSKKYG
ncbi:hypothetical protein [Parapedobacter defluvii]|uniref:hypothetical protein n=1 Tax=Parapedobacter defluvii TaxID=2045106 RepID=UPI000FC181D3|nr:MAG: hypothetical protein EAS52_03110 [Parapedobacter sp.]